MKRRTSGETEQRSEVVLLTLFSFCILHLLNIGRGAKNTSCMRVDARKIKWAYRKDPGVGFLKYCE